MDGIGNLQRIVQQPYKLLNYKNKLATRELFVNIVIALWVHSIQAHYLAAAAGVSWGSRYGRNVLPNLKASYRPNNSIPGFARYTP